MRLFALALWVAGCSGSPSPSDLGSAADLTPTRRVFITSTSFTGNFGGVGGADTACNSVATAANLGGHWKAWLSSSTENAIDRLADVGPWSRLDGYRVFDNKAQMMTPGDPLAPIDVDQTGFRQVGLQAWTGTQRGGQVAPGTIAQRTCKDWFSDMPPPLGVAPTGWLGSGDAKDDLWTSYAMQVDCARKNSLYCFEQ